MRRVTPLAVRFWAKVRKTKTCWLWTASTNGAGYGHIGLGRAGEGTIAAHRLSWKLRYGSLPPRGVGILHKCDTPRCVRPSHLFRGDQHVNMQDAMQKRRVPAGARHWNAKLSTLKVKKLRTWASAGVPQSEIARRLNVSQSTVSDVVRGRAWRQKR